MLKQVVPNTGGSGTVSSYDGHTSLHTLAGERGNVEIESFWTAWTRKNETRTSVPLPGQRESRVPKPGTRGTLRVVEKLDCWDPSHQPEEPAAGGESHKVTRLPLAWHEK